MSISVASLISIRSSWQNQQAHMLSSWSESKELISDLEIANCWFIFQVAVTIANEKSVSTVLNSIGRHLLKTDHVTWGKIASLFCVAGGLAIDCVQQGHPEYLYGIIETMGFVIERDAATWIAQQGGWVKKIKVYMSFF